MLRTDCWLCSQGSPLAVSGITPRLAVCKVSALLAEILPLWPFRLILTCIVVIEFNVLVFVSSDGDGERRVADDSVYLAGSVGCWEETGKSNTIRSTLPHTPVLNTAIDDSCGDFLLYAGLCYFCSYSSSITA